MEYETWRREMSGWARSRSRNVALFDSVDSTNRIGAEILGRATRPVGGCWVLALHQHAGMGRLGRSWASPHGRGVYASCVVETSRTVVPKLPQLVGVALCEALRRLGFECRLKWPNDVLLDGMKIGGILSSTRGISGSRGLGAGDSSEDSAAETVGAVLGFGVNHSHRRRELPRTDATSLRLAGASDSLSLARLSGLLAERIDDELEAIAGDRRESTESLVERYEAWSAHRPGDRMAVSCGDEVHEGEFAGFDADGQLRLRDGTEERLLSAGDLES